MIVTRFPSNSKVWLALLLLCQCKTYSFPPTLKEHSALDDCLPARNLCVIVHDLLASLKILSASPVSSCNRAFADSIFSNCFASAPCTVLTAACADSTFFFAALILSLWSFTSYSHQFCTHVPFLCSSSIVSRSANFS